MSSYPGRSAPDEVAFAELLGEVADAIASSVPAWRVRLGEAVSRWRAEGVATGILERALRLSEAPDVDGLLDAFAAALRRLRALEQEAIALDSTLARHAAFRDPARVAEAATLVTSARTASTAHTPLTVDGECWVHLWPDVDALLIEADA
jgi:hypothetical protein